MKKVMKLISQFTLRKYSPSSLNLLEPIMHEATSLSQKEKTKYSCNHICQVRLLNSLKWGFSSQQLEYWIWYSRTSRISVIHPHLCSIYSVRKHLIIEFIDVSEIDIAKSLIISSERNRKKKYFQIELPKPPKYLSNL